MYVTEPKLDATEPKLNAIILDLLYSSIFNVYIKIYYNHW